MSNSNTPHSPLSPSSPRGRLLGQTAVASTQARLLQLPKLPKPSSTNRSTRGGFEHAKVKRSNSLAAIQQMPKDGRLRMDRRESAVFKRDFKRAQQLVRSGIDPGLVQAALMQDLNEDDRDTDAENSFDLRAPRGGPGAPALTVPAAGSSVVTGFGHIVPSDYASATDGSDEDSRPMSGELSWNARKRRLPRNQGIDLMNKISQLKLEQALEHTADQAVDAEVLLADAHWEHAHVGTDEESSSSNGGFVEAPGDDTGPADDDDRDTAELDEEDSSSDSEDDLFMAASAEQPQEERNGGMGGIRPDDQESTDDELQEQRMQEHKRRKLEEQRRLEQERLKQEEEHAPPEDEDDDDDAGDDGDDEDDADDAEDNDTDEQDDDDELKTPDTDEDDVEAADVEESDNGGGEEDQVEVAALANEAESAPLLDVDLQPDAPEATDGSPVEIDESQQPRPNAESGWSLFFCWSGRCCGPRG